MEELLTECFREDEDALNLRDFEIYKSNICHLVKDKGDIDFITDILKENQIKIYCGKTRLFSKKNSLLISINFLRHYFDFYSENSAFNISSNRSAIGVKT